MDMRRHTRTLACTYTYAHSTTYSLTQGEGLDTHKYIHIHTACHTMRFMVELLEAMGMQQVGERCTCMSMSNNSPTCVRRSMYTLTSKASPHSHMRRFTCRATPIYLSSKLSLKSHPWFHWPGFPFCGFVPSRGHASALGKADWVGPLGKLGSLAAGLYTLLAPWYGLGLLGLALYALFGEVFLSLPPHLRYWKCMKICRL